MRKVIAVLGGFLVGCASAPVVVQEADTYNSWPMVQAMGSRLVCAYSRGSAHTIDEGARGVFVRHSDDAGRTWSEPTKVAPSAFGSVDGTGVPFCDNAPDGLRVLGPVAYGYKGDLPETLVIPGNVKYVMANLTENNDRSAVKTITLSDGVETIGSSAFENCTNLVRFLPICEAFGFKGGDATKWEFAKAPSIKVKNGVIDEEKLAAARF